jgi:Domain of unknown function (DUF4382)
MKIQKILVAASLMGSAMSFMTGCHKDAAESGQTSFEITDAPVDNANIKGVFVTVADIKVDGSSVAGFSKQTIDIKSLQNGTTATLVTAGINARTYSNVTLVLDLDKDAAGNSPGCYILKTTDEKFKLTNSTTASGQMTIVSSKSFQVVSNTASHIVVDFNLHKAIRETSSGNYSFSTNAGLVSALRVVDKNVAGSIRGTYSEQTATSDDKIAVFAYKKGTFNALTETQGQGEDEVQFKNAVSGTIVASDNTYVIPFLESGDYELHFAGYKKNADNMHYNLDALLGAEVTFNGALSDVVTVQANADASVSTKITSKLD